MKKFYTYCLIDPRDCQPFYVGKGTGRRMYAHWSNRKRLSNINLRLRLCELERTGYRPLYSIVLDNASSEDAFNKECELIAKYGRVDEGTGILCNMTCGGDGRVGWSQEQRLNKSQQELVKNKGRAVSQYTLKGELVATYCSAKRASEAVPQANRSYITQCCKKRRKSAGGFLWAYVGDEVPLYIHSYNRKVIQLTVAGDVVAEYRCVSEAANAVGAFPGDISSACGGKLKTCKKFVWRYS